MKVLVIGGTLFIGRRLVEDGPHENLMRTGGRYAALYRLQSGLHDVANDHDGLPKRSAI